MKIIQKIMLITMLLIVCVNVSAKELDDYKFPIVPGTEEWKNLRGRAERDKALRIPEDILQNMSTEGLIETCMNYPLYINFRLYNNYQKGIRTVILRFNGLQSLLQRNDRREKFVEYYDNLSNEKYNYNALFSFKLAYLELILSQEQNLDIFTKRNLVKLAGACLRKIEYFKSIKKYRGGLYLTSACFLARIMQKADYEPYLKIKMLPKEKRLLFSNLEKYCFCPSRSTAEAVVNLAKHFIADVEKGSKNE